MNYMTEHDTLDLVRDYLNGPEDEGTWDELRDFAEGILDAYRARHEDRDTDGPHFIPEDFAV